ncbi:hypothetical protein PIB30_030639 [Stylosanthes scabra]|uniref:Zinc finger GRF-type domain-containing protein n=1 Tax=Stylosanthes scabra TaxID=79078 RepID=A0ABU6YA07_9FABA|nr:hypothetical protein [Stylosanthes scabra]
MDAEASSSFESKMKLSSRVNTPLDSAASLYGRVSRRNLKRHHYNGGRCYHRLNPVTLKFRTTENPNRWFLRCPIIRCECFVWVDEVHDLDMKRNLQEKEMSIHKFS